jgi:hypothetical protein
MQPEYVDAPTDSIDASLEYVKVLREVDIRRAHVETQPEHVDALLTTWSVRARRHASAVTTGATGPSPNPRRNQTVP